MNNQTEVNDKEHAEGQSLLNTGLGLLVYKAEDIKTIDETLAKCQVVEEAFRQECSDSDELLKMIRLDPEIYRTECGYLNLPKIRAALAHPDDYPMMPNV